MKIKGLTLGLLVLLVLGCTPKGLITNPVEDHSQLKENINSCNSNWTSLQASANLDVDNIVSWLPESGVRGRYEIAKKYLSKSVLEKIIGQKAFVKGPHSTDMNFKSLKTFGHYNDKFILKLHAQLKVLFADPRFISNTKSLYDKELKNYLRTYYLAYAGAANNQKLMDGYLEVIANEPEPENPSERVFLSNPSEFLQESSREFAGSLGEGYDEYEGITCPGFWVRRSIDGTADEFYSLLKMTMKAYDADFLAANS